MRCIEAERRCRWWLMSVVVMVHGTLSKSRELQRPPVAQQYKGAAHTIAPWYASGIVGGAGSECKATRPGYFRYYVNVERTVSQRAAKRTAGARDAGGPFAPSSRRNRVKSGEMRSTALSRIIRCIVNNAGND